MKLSNRKKVVFIGALYQSGALMFIAVTLLLLFLNVKHAQASVSWPQTYGTVVSGVESRQVNGQWNVGMIWYEYGIGGKTYRSNRVSFFEVDELNKHPEGELVKVFYNPKDVQDACLVNGVSKAAIFKLYLCGAVFVWGFATLAAMIYSLCFAKLKKDSAMTQTEALALGSLISGLGSL